MKPNSGKEKKHTQIDRIRRKFNEKLTIFDTCFVSDKIILRHLMLVTWPIGIQHTAYRILIKMSDEIHSQRNRCQR